MTEPQPYELWLQRAESNLIIASTAKREKVFLEDLCFEAQQAAEKALKALLIFQSGDYPKKHSFTLLLAMLEEWVTLPDEIREVIEISDYSVQTRYPGDYYPISEEEYVRAVELAARVVGWVKNQLPGIHSSGSEDE